MEKKTSYLSVQIQGRIFHEGKEEASPLASYGKIKHQYPSSDWKGKIISDVVEAVYWEQALHTTQELISLSSSHTGIKYQLKLFFYG